MKKFYSDYVGHCSRYYFSTDETPSVNDRVNYNNFISVSNVLAKYDTAKENLIRFVYTSVTIMKGVQDYAFKNNLRNEEVWYVVMNFEKDVATERGLL